MLRPQVRKEYSHGKPCDSCLDLCPPLSSVSKKVVASMKDMDQERSFGNARHWQILAHTYTDCIAACVYADVIKACLCCLSIAAGLQGEERDVKRGTSQRKGARERLQGDLIRQDTRRNIMT
jgi:hypothetical protein